MLKLLTRNHSQSIPKNHKNLIYGIVFLFTLHATPSVYIMSSYLAQYIDATQIGFLYAVASFVTVCVFIYYRKVLRKFGNFRAVLWLMYGTLITLVLLIWAPTQEVVLGAFIANFVLTALFFMNMDIFLESETNDADTGGTRGLYLTSLNLAFVFGPFIASYFLTDDEFWKVFVVGIVVLIPSLYLVHKLSYFKDAEYEDVSIKVALKKLMKRPNVYFALQCGFVLRFFYSWMIIYSPLYLTQTVGFSIDETTLIIGVSVIPFILLEAILGKMADTSFGEKEILIIGMLIMALSTGLLFFLPLTQSLILWMGVLFVTRIGASMIEVMTETYVFKMIDSTDTSVMTFLRIIRPLAYVLGPILGSLVVYFLGMSWLFLILAIYILLSMNYAFRLKDTQ